MVTFAPELQKHPTAEISLDLAVVPNRAIASGACGIADLIDTERQLHNCRSVSALFALASRLARQRCGFSRALVVSMESETLTAAVTSALADPASDTLRRHLLAQPVPLQAGSVEAEFIRLGGRSGASRFSDVNSPLQTALGLDHFALGAIMPETRMLALLLVDRPWAVVDESAHEAVAMVSLMIARALERLLLRQRMQEFADEIRYLTASAQALVKESLEAPISLPSDNGSGPVFSMTRYPAAPASDELWRVFTRRELDILPHIVAGLSNRDIAAKLQLSPETVKKYVARLLRKLGAVNRSDAAVKYVRLASSSDPTVPSLVSLTET